MSAIKKTSSFRLAYLIIPQKWTEFEIIITLLRNSIKKWQADNFDDRGDQFVVWNHLI